jgi:hypothetical protein
LVTIEAATAYSRRAESLKRRADTNWGLIDVDPMGRASDEDEGEDEEDEDDEDEDESEASDGGREDRLALTFEVAASSSHAGSRRQSDHPANSRAMESGSGSDASHHHSGRDSDRDSDDEDDDGDDDDRRAAKRRARKHARAEKRQRRAARRERRDREKELAKERTLRDAKTRVATTRWAAAAADDFESKHQHASSSSSSSSSSSFSSSSFLTSSSSSSSSTSSATTSDFFFDHHGDADNVVFGSAHLADRARYRRAGGDRVIIGAPAAWGPERCQVQTWSGVGGTSDQGGSIMVRLNHGTLGH